MAICDVVPGIEAELIIDGVAALEIQDPDDIQVEHRIPGVAKYQAARTVSKYIEAETDTHFGIRVSIGAPIVRPDETPLKKMLHTKIRFHIYIDGKLVWVPTCGRPHFKDGAVSWEETVDGLKEGKGRKCTLKKFKFAKLQTTDDMPAQAKMQRLTDKMKKVGLIEIRVYSENYGKPGGDVGTSSKGFVKDDDIIPEKALKGDAKSHGVGLNEPEKTNRGPVWRSEKKDGEQFPLIIFKFMYRDNYTLKILGLIPRTPSPSASRDNSTERSVSIEIQPSPNQRFRNLAPEQQRELLSRLLPSNNSRSKRKSSKQIKKIKKEDIEDSRKVRGRKCRRGNEREVIVIDDSDEETQDGSLSTLRR